ncbi:glycoside hydrolase family 2 protein [Photobacterium nomapromontoriensis]|uniref:glycoside hydrolase family 2 protein n=1 Tax=Photobacterium nomapromontoriensis TaxID=2910237 RepID=UPI003D0B76C2
MRIILLLMLFSLSSCVRFSADNGWDINKQSLNGEWQLEIIDEEHGRARQLSVLVPGHWKSAGINYAGEATYQHVFTIDRVSPQTRYWLYVDAVDYASVVSLNDKNISRQEGYFLPQHTEFTDIVKRGENTLNIHVTSHNESNAVDWSLHKTLIKGVLSHHDTRPGGAWSEYGQDWNSGGVWGDVYIAQTGPIAIRDMRVKTTVVDVEREITEARVTFTLDSRVKTRANIKIMVKSSQNNESETYQILRELDSGTEQITYVLPEKKRALWWPWDWGKANLFDITVSVDMNGKRSDTLNQQVGFRRVKLDSNEKQLFINDRPYFVRGTNYIASQWLGEFSIDDYQYDLSLMKEANINSIRVHAHVAGPAFYQLADKMGFIVWQDFPLQWGYSDTISFKNEAIRQANSMVSMLNSHPSIVFWSGHNEPPWDATWMQYKYKTYKPTQNVALTEAVYQTLLAADDGRVVRKASYTYEHPWLGWYSGSYTDYKTFTPPMIVSEFGAQAMPSWLMVTDIIQDEGRWPLDNATVELLKYHNYQPHETLNIAKIQQGESLSQFWNNSQEYQRLVTKFSAEQLRLNKGKGVAAIYQFMFVDSWPSVTWSILDVDRIAKPAYEALKLAYQPLLVTAQLDLTNPQPLMTVVIVNDTLSHYDDVTVRIFNNYGNGQWTFKNISIPANEQITLFNDKVIGGIASYFSIEIYDKEGEVISQNRYRSEDLRVNH